MTSHLWEIGLRTIQELEVENGILASSQAEAYGAIFGRDSLITCLTLLNTYRKTHNEQFLSLCRKILINLAPLQGQQINWESGEQPGKMIHEFRPTGHERLTKREQDPWHIYEDGIMRNYDSVDATPLFLIAIHRYWQASGDELFVASMRRNVDAALAWIETYGDNNKDGFIDYQRPAERSSGGLVVHSWMDSHDSVFHEDGSPVVFPVAPVEVQAYTYLALTLWGKHFKDEHGTTLLQRAAQLKEQFNAAFVLEDIIACGIDGEGKPLRSMRSSTGHCLWASLSLDWDGERDCILKDEYIPLLVRKLMAPDMYVPTAGIRTLSSDSRYYEPHSYHNGSIWPHDVNMVRRGLELFGYKEEADAVRSALLKAIDHFRTPIELFVYEKADAYSPYITLEHTSCTKQAWSAAALLEAADPPAA
jgi:glycogen debranching enzyme